MKKITAILFCALLALAVSESTYADGSHPWYHGGETTKTLSEAFAKQKEFLGSDNPGYKMQGNKETCALFRKLELPCDYNSRSTLSMFLTVNGKGLFHATGRTNPYVFEDRPEDGITRFRLSWPDDVYIGAAAQNTILIDAVRRNAALFKDGDLTAEDVRSRWR